MLEEFVGDLEPGQSLPEEPLKAFVSSGIPEERVKAIADEVFGWRPFALYGWSRFKELLSQEPQYSYDVIFNREDAQDE